MFDGIHVYIKLVALPTTNHCGEHDGAVGPITFVLQQHLAHSREPVTSDHSFLRTSNQVPDLGIQVSGPRKMSILICQLL